MTTSQIFSATGYLLGLGIFLFIQITETNKYNKKAKKKEIKLKQCIN